MKTVVYVVGIFGVVGLLVWAGLAGLDKQALCHAKGGVAVRSYGGYGVSCMKSDLFLKLD